MGQFLNGERDGIVSNFVYMGYTDKNKLSYGVVHEWKLGK